MEATRTQALLQRNDARHLTERSFLNLKILSHNETTPQIRIQSIGTVSIDAS